jgi:predicted transcriptional regulator
MVVDGGSLIGVITYKDILQYFSARMDLEEYT